jgi:hypothetical protein
VNRAEFHQQLYSEKFEAYCQKWRRLLNLNNWEIDYQLAEVVEEDGGILAQVKVNTSLGHKATITFAERIGHSEDHEREDTVAHEHIHIMLDELGQFVYQNMPGEHHAYFTRLMEIAVSDLGRVMLELEKGPAKAG